MLDGLGFDQGFAAKVLPALDKYSYLLKLNPSSDSFQYLAMYCMPRYAPAYPPYPILTSIFESTGLSRTKSRLRRCANPATLDPPPTT